MTIVLFALIVCPAGLPGAAQAALPEPTISGRIDMRAASVSIEVEAPSRRIVTDAGAGGYQAFPDVCRLKNGDLLLTFGERNAPRGAVAMLSHDDGKTWDPKTRMVLGDDAPLYDCGYSSSVQLPDGRIVTVYYKVVDAATAPASTSLNAVIWRLPK